MNDFHIFSLCIAQRNKNKAMLLLRDKSEFAARKILEKASVRVPACAGKLFWRWVQNWIFSVCRQENDSNTRIVPANTNSSATLPPHADNAESLGTQWNKRVSPAAPVAGSGLHLVSLSDESCPVSEVKNGLSVDHACSGTKRDAGPSTFPATVKQATNREGRKAAGVPDSFASPVADARSALTHQAYGHVSRADYFCHHSAAPGAWQLWRSRPYDETVSCAVLPANTGQTGPERQHRVDHVRAALPARIFALEELTAGCFSVDHFPLATAVYACKSGHSEISVRKRADYATLLRQPDLYQPSVANGRCCHSYLIPEERQEPG